MPPDDPKQKTVPADSAKASPVSLSAAPNKQGQHTTTASAATDGYPTAWKAAFAALCICNPKSIQSMDANDRLSTGTEYGGLIYKKGTRFYYTEPIAGDVQGHVDVWEALSKVPADCQSSIVGDYHTHGGK